MTIQWKIYNDEIAPCRDTVMVPGTHLYRAVMQLVAIRFPDAVVRKIDYSVMHLPDLGDIHNIDVYMAKSKELNALAYAAYGVHFDIPDSEKWERGNVGLERDNAYYDKLYALALETATITFAFAKTYKQLADEKQQVGTMTEQSDEYVSTQELEEALYPYIAGILADGRMKRILDHIKASVIQHYKDDFGQAPSDANALLLTYVNWVVEHLGEVMSD